MNCPSKLSLRSEIYAHLHISVYIISVLLFDFMSTNPFSNPSKLYTGTDVQKLNQFEFNITLFVHYFYDDINVFHNVLVTIV